MVADPLSMTVRYHQGIVPLWAGELQEAWGAFSALEGPGPALFLKSHGRAYVHAARGEYREALEALSSALEVAGDHRVIVLGFMGCLEGRLGMEEEARNRLLELDGLGSRGIHVDPVSRAQIHVGLGDLERALALLEEGYEERTHWMIYLGNPPWEFSELRTEPRFRELLAKMNFPRFETGGAP
jgi:tetratricopeptide (TPR) repeat protein